MSEREHLLLAIRNHWAEDVPRLEYADWLDECGDCDRDTATAAFIRISCTMRRDKRGKTPNVMPRVAYKWIEENWKRLVPDTLALSKWYTGTDSTVLPSRRLYVNAHNYMASHKGRSVWTQIGLLGPSRGGQKLYTRSITFEFFRGFVIGAKSCSRFAQQQIFPVLKKEQPFFDREWEIEAATLDVPTGKPLSEIL